MYIESALTVHTIVNNTQTATEYQQWVNPKTHKHEQRIEVHLVHLYTSKGQLNTYTNKHELDVSV